MNLRSEDPPGAASSDYLSDAARVSWIKKKQQQLYVNVGHGGSVSTRHVHHLHISAFI